MVQGGRAEAGVEAAVSSPESRRGREQQLLDEARRLFSHRGYKQTTLQEITEGLGITRPLFYYYFESKADLLWRLIGHLGQDLLVRARRINSGDLTAVDKLVQISAVQAEVQLQNWQSYRVYFAERREVVGKRDKILRQGEEEFNRIMVGVIEQGQQSGVFRAGDSAMLCQLTMGATNSIVGWYDPSQHDAEEVGRLLTDLALRSLLLAGGRS